MAGLLQADAYPHPCDPPQLIETHISWILLTGSYAYKLKKPVKLDFVDFSTLARREHFCREEVRCNRAFAPSLYRDVVRVVRCADGTVAVDGEGVVLEWAVRMRQFDGEQQLDRLLAAGALTLEPLQRFGRELAERHAARPARPLSDRDLEPLVLAPMRDNVTVLRRLRNRVGALAQQQALLERVAAAMEMAMARARPQLLGRMSHSIRECHGDLHLANLVLLDGVVTAFDCLEFDPALRWIDPMSDVAFLYMDCCVRGRADLAYAFVDGYLDASGDYDGARLLPLYAAYRAMVRAKVAAIRATQDDAATASSLPDLLDYLRWAERLQSREPGRLVLTCGLSGSGKSYLAQRLAARLPALRLRSDVARKRLAGLTPDTAAGAAVGEGLYRPGFSDAVYDGLADTAEALLAAGDDVLVDAAFLEAGRRARFLAIAERHGVPGVVLWCDAPVALLRERVTARAAAGQDPSDADLAVLARQQDVFETPGPEAVRVDTSLALGEERLAAICDSIRRVPAQGR
ncbi:MAG: AAA family ATPase [Pseudomonadales bacterium]